MASQQIAQGEDPKTDPHPDYDPNDKKGRDPDKGNPKFQDFWDNLMEAGAPFFPGMPFDQLKAVALAAWKQGKTKQEIRKLFGQKAASIFQSNAAGGEGQPSPYLQYFLDNPDQAGALIDLLNSEQGLVGPEQQQAFFDRFEGLRESYMTSLGYEQAPSGRWYDPDTSKVLSNGNVAYNPAWNLDGGDLTASQMRAQASVSSGGPTEAGSPYMNIDPNTPYQTYLGPMRNLLAGHAAQAFTTGDPDAIQRATQNMNAYADWYARFNATFATPTPGAEPLPKLSGFDYDQMISEAY